MNWRSFPNETWDKLLAEATRLNDTPEEIVRLAVDMWIQHSMQNDFSLGGISVDDEDDDD